MAISASQVKELRERTGLGMLECKKALAESQGDIEAAIDNLRKVSGLKAAKKADRTAAEGVVAVRLSPDNAYGVLIEVNSETDFVARDEGFLGFVNLVVDNALETKQIDVATLMNSEISATREALVQKIGENINLRRAHALEGGTIGAYVHSNHRIGVLVKLDQGSEELAKDIAMHVAAVNPQVISPEQMPEDLVQKEKEIIKAQPDMEGKPEAIVEKMMVGRINKFLKENSLLEQPFVKNPDQTIKQLITEAGATIQDFVRFEVGEGIEVTKVDFAEEVAAQVQATR